MFSGRLLVYVADSGVQVLTSFNRPTLGLGLNNSHTTTLSFGTVNLVSVYTSTSLFATPGSRIDYLVSQG